MKKLSLILIAYAGLLTIAIFVSTTQTIADRTRFSKQQQVYKHRKSRDILSFKEILKAVRPRIKGEIIETEFEIEHGIPTYEFKYIDKSGRVREMYVNAKTGKIIKDKLD